MTHPFPFSCYFPSFLYEGIPAYGGLYHSTGQLVSFQTVNTPVQLRMDSPMPLKDVIASNNTLIVEQDGDYEINFNILLNISSSATMTVAVRQNMVPIPAASGTQILSTNDSGTSFNGHLIASSIVRLNAHDVLDLTLSPASPIPPGFTATANRGINTSLSIKKLNGGFFFL